jgi:ABC-type sugar transport system permease subunit
MKGKKSIDWPAYLFMLPALIIYISVIVFPVFYSLYVSLHKWNGIGEMEFIGLSNYVKLITQDDIFLIAIKNNAIWIVLTVAFITAISLGFAVILNKQFKGRTFFRGFFYFPAVIAPIAVAIIWRWIYNPNIGFINEFFGAIGLDFKQNWISNPETSLYAIFIAALWQGIGQPMIIFLAGLQTVPVEVLEAATIDGAGSVRKFIHVTIPMMKETFIIVLATLIVAALKVFDVIQGLTGGGPNNSTQMLSTYMYSQTFKYANVGTGTAISVIMVLIMIFIIVPYVSFTAKED